MDITWYSASIARRYFGTEAPSENERVRRDFYCIILFSFTFVSLRVYLTVLVSLRVIEATRNTAERRGLYGHMMLYGKPGTGTAPFPALILVHSHSPSLSSSFLFVLS